MDRRGFELAAGLIVILIASIVIFGLAGTVTYKILCISEDKLDSYSEQQRQSLEKRLATGASVVVADASKSANKPSSICQTSSSLGADFLIGVRNDEAADTSMSADCTIVQLEVNGVMSSPSVDCNAVQSVSTGNLKVGARSTIPVIVNLPSNAEPGRYIITMKVGGASTRVVNLYLTLE